jgi:hypothetical protein
MPGPHHSPTQARRGGALEVRLLESERDLLLIGLNLDDTPVAADITMRRPVSGEAHALIDNRQLPLTHLDDESALSLRVAAGDVAVLRMGRR